jgi:hypothetical protein
VVDEVLASPGQPLEPTARGILESRFGRDLSRVRVHADAPAAASARAVQARAYTVGHDIVFGAGQYHPHDPRGARLLAHELAHVVQAGAGPAGPGPAPLRAAPTNSPAERQAGRMADAVLAGHRVSESPIPADGLQRQPEGGEGSSSNWRSNFRSMASWLAEWHGAGLLDPPFRPPDVPALPPMPITQQQAQALNLGPAAVVAGAAPALQPGQFVEPVPPSRPPLRLVPPSTGPAPGPAPAARPWFVPSPFATGVFVAAAILLTPTSTAPRWMDELNPITGEPYTSPDEYTWVRRLNPRQEDYLRWLSQARRISPDPTLEDDPDPNTIPQAQPQPRPREDESERPCFAADVPRRGGHRRHDAYATKVSTSPWDFLVAPPVPYRAICYDGSAAGSVVVWEVKVGYGWLFSSNPKYIALRDRVLARFDAQKNLGLDVARRCRYVHYWSIPDRWVAALLTARWGGTPPVFSVPE